jgi:hypothetical protein
MSKTILTLVFAEEPKGAVGSAVEVVEKILENTAIFFDGAYVKGRWVLVPSALQVSTARFPTDDKRGLQMVNSAMDDNRKLFKEDVAYIRYLIANYTDDQLFDEIEGKGWIEELQIYDDPSCFRYNCKGAGGDFAYPATPLYDFAGYPIYSSWELQGLLNAHIWNQPLWVVPFDVHFS